MGKAKESGSCCGLLRWCDAYQSNSSTTKASSSPHELCRHFSLAAIRKATNNFDNAFFIGEGVFGKVYKGHIDGGNTIVAIKRSNSGSHQGGYKIEFELLSKLRHPHLVSLIGYCNQKQEMILVSDYMANGSLYNHLHGTGNDPLPWKQRLEICIGAAKGLHFLHSGGKLTIIHRDVKSINIFLDEKWVAKVSNFGLSLMGPSGMPNTAVSDDVKGSLGYLDLEYMSSGRLTEKSDVYSFGVVLFEVLSGRKAFDRDLDVDQVFLANWAQNCIGNGTIDQIIDPYLSGRIAPVCLKEFVVIAQSCLRPTAIERPMMGDVVEGLEFILQLQESADAANEENNEYIYQGMSFSSSITSAHKES